MRTSPIVPGDVRGATMKTCRTCRKLKTLSEFPKNRNSRDKHGDRCSACQREYYIANRDRLNNAAKARYAENKVEILARIRQRNEEKAAGTYVPRRRPARVLTPEEDAQRKHRARCLVYGLTPADFEEILWAQGMACAICDRTFKSYRNIHIDHCHRTGVIRGFLCARCNVGLGQFDDNAERLVSALRYLTTAGETSKFKIGPETYRFRRGAVKIQ